MDYITLDAILEDEEARTTSVFNPSAPSLPPYLPYFPYNFLKQP